MFEQIVRFQAKQHPNRPAVITPHGVTSFRSLHADVQRFAQRLRTAVAPGSVAAIALDRSYRHVVAAAALAQLGVTFVSVGLSSRREVLQLVGPDLVLWDPEAGPAPDRALVVDASWSRSPVPEPPAPLRPLAPAGPVAIQLSAGAAGEARKIAYAREQFDARLFSFASAIEVGPDSRVLSLMGLNTAVGAFAPWAAWMWGGAWVSGIQLLLEPARPRRVKPNLLIATPDQLRALPPRLASAAEPMPWLSIWCSSGALAPAASAEVRRRLTPRLHRAYGSPEAGPTAGAMAADLEAREGAVGYPYPWAEVTIVDDEGRVLPAGSVGRVRIRTPGMIRGYLGDAASSRAGFNGGWFLPGDLGSLGADGLLTLTGRATDLLNVGDAKVAV